MWNPHASLHIVPGWEVNNILSHLWGIWNLAVPLPNISLRGAAGQNLDWCNWFFWPQRYQNFLLGCSYVSLYAGLIWLCASDCPRLQFLYLCKLHHTSHIKLFTIGVTTPAMLELTCLLARFWGASFVCDRMYKLEKWPKTRSELHYLGLASSYS